MESVLVVDDDRILAELLIEALEDQGYRARGVSNVASAYEYVVQGWPDIMLLDVHLPGIDGWTFLDVCRAGLATDLPVVMLSASRETHAGTDGTLAFLPKPFDLAMLSRTVQHISKRRICNQQEAQPQLYENFRLFVPPSRLRSRA